MRLSWLDLSIYVCFLVAVFAVGIRAGRGKKDTAEEYFLAGGRIPWYAIGMSIIAASISTEQFLGEVGFAYRYGLAVANWEWSVFIAQTLLAFVFVPVFLRQRIVTVPEFLTRRFDERTGTLFSVLLVISYAFINLAGVLYLGGFLLEALFGVNKWLAVWGLAAIAGGYTIYGGLRSVVWTDLLQGSVLLGGGILVFFRGLQAVPGGFSTILGEGERAHLMLPSSHPDLPWTAIVVLALCTNTFYYCTNQYINQRCLAARNEWHARMGIVFAAFLGIPLVLAVTFPGMIAFALNPSLEVADSAYPFVVTTLVPLGLRGFVFAALTGAVLSTVASLVSASSSIVAVNFYRQYLRPAATGEQIVRAGRYAGFATLLIGALWSPVVERFELAFAYFQECWVFFAAPVVVVFVGGILWPRATPRAGFATLLLGFPMLALVFVRRWYFPEINPFLLAGAGGVLMAGFFVAVSLATPPAREKAVGNVWLRSMLVLAKKGAPRRWWRSEIFWWAVMILTYAGLYTHFW